jgi:hypothetical protein
MITPAKKNRTTQIVKGWITCKPILVAVAAEDQSKEKNKPATSGQIPFCKTEFSGEGITFVTFDNPAGRLSSGK